MVSDPVGDLIVRITNAGAVKKETIEVPYSKLKHAVAEVLAEKGYVKSVAKRGKVKQVLVIALAYENNGKPRIRGVKRVSKPGRRLYAGVHAINPVKFGRGTMVLSTPNGIRTGEDAKKENVGGEQLFTIW